MAGLSHSGERVDMQVTVLSVGRAVLLFWVGDGELPWFLYLCDKTFVLQASTVSPAFTFASHGPQGCQNLSRSYEPVINSISRCTDVLKSMFLKAIVAEVCLIFIFNFYLRSMDTREKTEGLQSHFLSAGSLPRCFQKLSSAGPGVRK